MMDQSANAASKALEVMAFTVGSLEFCVEIVSVREIRGWTPATPIPHAPTFIAGVINLRGVVLPIIDLAERLGLPKAVPTARHVIIVTQVGTRMAGLLVDTVSDITSFDAEIIQSTPDVASSVAKSFIRGVVALEGRMISILTLDRVFLASDKEAA